MVDPIRAMDKGYGYKATLWLVIGIIAAFFIWAGTTQIDQQVRGQGRVAPAGKARVIQHLEGGIITDIHVQEGQTVEAGTQLFSITNARAVAERNETALDRDALLLRKIRLMAEYEGKSTLEFDPALAEKHAEIAATEMRIFSSRQDEFSKRIGGFDDRRKQKILKLSELATSLGNLEKEADVARQQLTIKTKLRNSGAISQSQYLEAQSLVRNFNTQIARAQAEIPITRAELAEVQSQIEETRKGRKADVAQELNEVNLNIKRQDERFSASTDLVQRTTIVSPVKGIISKIQVNTIGGVLKPGDDVAEIIPLDEKLIIEGRVATRDRGKIWLGLPVKVKVSAYDYSLYGGVDGKISYISADSFIDNKGVEYYQVRVALDSVTLKEGQELMPGMTVDMNIIAGKISVIKAILRPFRNITDNALAEK